MKPRVSFGLIRKLEKTQSGLISFSSTHWNSKIETTLYWILCSPNTTSVWGENCVQLKQGLQL